MNKHRLTTAFALAYLGATPTMATVTLNYAYDDLNRVTAAVRSDGPEFSFDYDDMTNIVRMDFLNPDSDGDGLKDIEEIQIHGTEALISDSDGDGLSDADEVHAHNTNPLNSDSDNDGFSDGQEIQYGSDPLDSGSVPAVADGDLNGDGLVDAADVMLAERIVLGQLDPDQNQSIHGDVAPLADGTPSPDGKIDINDLQVIKRKALGHVNF
ncbi:hypothetical protein TspCOW1_17760 [Thiohalobacter sp. COW1]|uniref:dockerin type I repeat-containing protein n=1 Tax=Thiohalobacter sp. COW1 TaxID=2795687 RepID=UPI0019159A52|nr:dockerin type I repeat-containing protein [Thiohalobacter sp. COW1]BCO31673.1 hypothetical protein TspCOW1_17760 [Thiohalobacter sp. COW1]